MDMSSQCVWLIDPDQPRAAQIQTVLEFMQASVHCQATVEWQEAGSVADEMGRCDMIWLSEDTPRLAQVAKALQAHWADTPLVLLTRSSATAADIPTAVEACVASVQPWPFQYPDLIRLLQHLKNGKRAASVNREMRRSVNLFRSLTGHSASIQETRRLIQQVADTDATVLVLGESGTGKEVVARNLHYHSSRRDRPFVPMNCGAIPGELLESELFGHEKGAFTGALNARQGRFELAEGGTLFLDEIGDMPLSMQVKILRVLQEQTFERVGSNQVIECNVRIIAATHRDLVQEIQQNRFREDLYYRLNVFPIEIPALRNRVEDIDTLVADLMARMQHEGRTPIRFSRSALDVLQQYHWPGNVRELANLVERLAILYPGVEINASHLPEKLRASLPASNAETTGAAAEQSTQALKSQLPSEGLDLKQHMTDLECAYIRQALSDCNGVVKHAAERLGIRRTTLIEKMRKYKLQRDDSGPGSTGGE